MNFFSSFLQNFEEVLKKPAISLIIFIVIVLIFSIVAFFLGCFYKSVRYHSDLKKNRKDAVNRPRSVLKGQISEQLAPYLPNFPCSPDCVQFLGKPVDFIGFVPENDSGSSDEQKIKEILFIEIKSGNAVQSKREKEVQRAIEQGHVRYTVVRV